MSASALNSISKASFSQPPSTRVQQRGTPRRAQTDRHDDQPSGLLDERVKDYWHELLTDLCLLGQLRMKSRTDKVRIDDLLDLPALSTDGAIATLSQKTRSLRLLLGRCCAIATTPERDTLLLQDNLGRALVRLRPAGNSGPRLWKLVLGATFGSAPRIVLRSAAPTAAIHSGPEPALEALQEMTGDDAPNFRDVAELTGQISLQIARLRREQAESRRRCTAVDPALVPHALRAMSEELLPLAITAGTDALVLRRRGVFHGFELQQGWARLRTEATGIDLDTNAVDSAWVIGTGDCGNGARQLRLYDAAGRALALIGPDIGGCDGQGMHEAGCRNCAEPRCWRTLMNALES